MIKSYGGSVYRVNNIVLLLYKTNEFKYDIHQAFPQGEGINLPVTV